MHLNKNVFQDNPPNPCSSNPCLNGGICLNYGTSYTCSCPQFYSGPNCANCGFIYNQLTKINIVQFVFVCR